MSETVDINMFWSMLTGFDEYGPILTEFHRKIIDFRWIFTCIGVTCRGKQSKNIRGTLRWLAAEPGGRATLTEPRGTFAEPWEHLPRNPGGRATLTDSFTKSKDPLSEA